jgi:subtilisin family serine protease
MNSFSRIAALAALGALAGACALDDEALQDESQEARSGKIGINVVLNTSITDALLAQLGEQGMVRDVVPSLQAVTMQTEASRLSAIRALPFVAAANTDAPRGVAPSSLPMNDGFANGMSTWDLDQINVTDFGGARVVQQTGQGVYVAVLDTGLVDNWQFYFQADHIDVARARAFGGGGGEVGSVSSQPLKWGHDQHSHGTHVTSTVLGYRFPLGGSTVQFNGTAPGAMIIPVKVLNQNGSGWSSVVARGITYVADLKASGALGSAPVVINMSLGGPSLDAMEKAAVDYAVANGVVIVASAGNEGEAGMGFPGAYEPVISVAASGWTGEWTTLPSSSWWRSLDVADPTAAGEAYITTFSSREHAGQDLDVAAPGSWVVGPFQVNGQLSWFFLSGTSMASPHVAGVAALLLQKAPGLTAPDIDGILTSTALPLGAGCRSVINPNTGSARDVCWGEDASGAGLVRADAALAATP